MPISRRCRSLARSETQCGLGAGHRACFLNAFQIARLAPSALDRPTGAPSKHRSISIASSVMRAVAADARPGFGEIAIRQAIAAPLQHRRIFRPVSIVRTPHEMSNPTPPADTTPPSSGSNAATPPIGKP